MAVMRVYLGGDHAGYEFKKAIIAHLTKAGHEAIDCGAFTYDAEDDYPAFCIAAAPVSYTHLTLPTTPYV